VAGESGQQTAGGPGRHHASAGDGSGSAVTVVEVGPRDGLQSLDAGIDTAHKLAMVTRLIEAGLTEIEVTSFAHPRMVPRLADAEALMAALPRRDGVTVRALVPNRRGAERAIAAGADVLLGMVSASAAYGEKNQNMTLEQALGQLEEIAALASEHGRPWGCAVSMAFASPYEDRIDPADVLALVDRVVALEPADLYVADTIARAAPQQVASLCAAIRARHPQLALGVHLHGSDARGLACAARAVDAGVTRVECAVLGLGGPVVRSPGVDPAGNLATEAVVATFAALGIDTGLDPERVGAAARDVSEILGVAPQADAPALADVRARIAETSPAP
jgi:hydroxymethylglutaryl-CoA lyase